MKFAIANMTPVKVSCEPKELPSMELVYHIGGLCFRIEESFRFAKRDL